MHTRGRYHIRDLSSWKSAVLIRFDTDKSTFMLCKSHSAITLPHHLQAATCNTTVWMVISPWYRRGPICYWFHNRNTSLFSIWKQWENQSYGTASPYLFIYDISQQRLSLHHHHHHHRNSGIHLRRWRWWWYWWREREREALLWGFIYKYIGRGCSRTLVFPLLPKILGLNLFRYLILLTKCFQCKYQRLSIFWFTLVFSRINVFFTVTILERVCD